MKQQGKSVTADPDKSRIYEVAKQAGVSIVTVSRVFNDYPHVSERMRHRVFAAAREVGYTPRLVSKRSLIGILTGHIDNLSAGDYKTTLMMHIIQEAALQGFLVEFIPFDALELATKNLVDGIIEVGLTSEEIMSLEHLPQVPTVLTNKDRMRKALKVACSDHRDEARMAVEHLGDKGHRRIALVLDEKRGWGPESRYLGFEETLARFKGGEGLILSAGDESPRAIAEHIRDEKCTAAILFTDNAGFAVFDALANDLGLIIPDEVSVIALENRSVSRFIKPRLTTVEQPLAEIAQAAVQCIIQSVMGRRPRSETIFKSRLVVRDSVISL